MNITKNHKDNELTVLSEKEMEKVSGGLFWLPFTIGVAITGAAYAYYTVKKKYR